MADTKRGEVSAEALLFAYTTMSNVFDINVANETKLKEVIDYHQHLMMVMQHDIILRDGSKHV